MNSNTQIIQPPTTSKFSAQKLLNHSAKFWFAVTLFGQWFFVYYIAAFYGTATVAGDFEKFNQALIKGIVPGDVLGNSFLLLHILLAFVITFGGPLQLFPQLQKKAKTFHRWNGRLYILTAILIAFSGLFMIATRPITDSFFSKFGQTMNASLIIIFSILAWRTAANGNILAHRKWAIRSFLMVSGVWFMRVAYGFWILINAGTAPGSTDNFDGPFDIFLSLGHWAIPLIIVELYFWAQERGETKGKFSIATLLFIIGLCTAAGLFITTQAFWLRLL